MKIVFEWNHLVEQEQNVQKSISQLLKNEAK